MQTLSFKQKAIIALVIGLIGYVVLNQFGIGPSFQRQAAVAPKSFAMPNEVKETAPTVKTVSASSIALPSSTPAKLSGISQSIETIPWNATVSLQLAIGGTTTMKGGLMEKHGVPVVIKVVNDSSVSRENQLKFASALASGTNSDGPAFVITMGDSDAQYIGAYNKAAERLGPEYVAEVVGHVGYSYGEDGWWGPQAWKDNPDAMKGGATAGVLLDGDWDVALNHMSNVMITNADGTKTRGLKNNPDVTTWDPDAMNWFGAENFEKAVEMFVAGYCEPRPVVRNGKLTNEAKHNTCVEAHVTWTPADVASAKDKGGLVRLLSTKENPYQMPATLIGVRKWNITHTKAIEEMLLASYEACDQIHASDAALQRGAKAEADVYADKTAGFWFKYYIGSDGHGLSADGTRKVPAERDKTGQPVPLGGSRCATLSDALAFYGLVEGVGGPDASLWKAIYEGFGSIAHQQYPKLVQSYPKYNVAFNSTFLKDLAARATPDETDVAKANLPTFAEGTIEKSDRVASLDYTINFDTGSATFKPEALPKLEEIYIKLQQGAGLAVDIGGHTDNVGNPDTNLGLSTRRAAAVKNWLVVKAPLLFGKNRVTVTGYGDTQPTQTNTTEAGRAANRRVTIVLGTKS
jgi:OOP family OmpA-OmpF porin